MGLYGRALSLSEDSSIKLESSYLSLLNESIDMDTGEGGEYRPVFIVLMYCDSLFDKVVTKFVKTETYWHSAIGFGPSLKYLYSFNYRSYGANKLTGGLSFESVTGYQEEYPDADFYVSCILLDKERYDILKQAVRWFIINKRKTKYDFPNILRMNFNKSTRNGMKLNLVCSTFIDTVLKQAGIDLNQGINSNLVRPDDLISKTNQKQFEIFKGKVIDYNPVAAKRKVEEMVDDESYDFFGRSELYA